MIGAYVFIFTDIFMKLGNTLCSIYKLSHLSNVRNYFDPGILKYDII